jgi:beta-galactosidase
MQKKVLSLVLAVMPWIAIAQPKNNDWENPTLPSFNTVTPHAWFVPYPDEPAAIQQQSGANILSLDGIWKFHIVSKPSERPTDFYKKNYDVSKWSEIPVPANWQTVGKDSYIFTDVEYPIKVNPPYVPEEFNPVGSYKRSFQIPAGWKTKDVFLRFGAVNSFFYCWINDHYVGFSKDSKTPAEFDITPYLKPGSNTVAVQVFRFSDGTYLEGQDMWKLSGIERSVELIARPKLAVYDFFAKAGLDASYTHGVFDCTLTLNRKPKSQKQIALQIKVLDEKGNLLYQQKQSSDTGRHYRFRTILNNVKRWTAETPSLYTMVVNSFDKNGKLIESFAHRIGFRTAEVKHGLFLINGVPVKIKGVNRHEHDMFTAKVISKESMIRDIKVMKAYNINAVRNSHYPNREEWYQLCDQYGIYLVDEANIECDGMDFHDMKTLSDKPDWKNSYMDRTRRMFERDKNFTSIITWSLGNESRFGDNFIATYQFLKASDDTRPVEYDEARDNPYTDIITPMYRGVHALQEYVKEWRSRPYILCEYAHMMGNGGGNLQAYWDLIYKHRQLQGGFIWDFSDQTFEKRDAAGRSFWAYGRDMGNVGATSDTSFCADGLFDAARNPHPQAFELKKVYQPISFSAVGLTENTIRLINRTDFTHLNEYTLHWFIKADGKIIVSGNEAIPAIAPQATGEMELKIPSFTRQPGTEYFLTLEARTNTATALLPAGYAAAWEQFKLPGDIAAIKVEKKNAEPLQQQQANGMLSIGNKDFTVSFNQQSGWLSQYKFAGQEMLKDALLPHFWRAPTDTDIGNSMQIRCAIWQQPLEGARLDSFNVVKLDEYHTRLRTLHYLPLIDAFYKVEYNIRSNGDVQVIVSMKAGNGSLPEMPRFGMRVLLNPEFNKVSWFGRGPFDNYDDRKTAAGIDLYSMPGDSLFHPYPRAQESGYRTDVRWMGMQNRTGTGLMAIGSPTISTGVLHFDMKKLEFDRHAKENNHGGSMHNDPLIWWNIDYKQMGVGGDNSWGARTHAEYMLPYMDYSYTFTLRPIGASDMLTEKAK